MNYNLEMEKIISQNQKENKIPRLLLHSCCAPCSSTCLERLTEYFDITILYYNPNIEPKEEYELRKQEEISFISRFPHKNKIEIVDCDYDNKLFHSTIRGYERMGEGSERCYKCYHLRLAETAKVAKELEYDFFATTLTLSPYKNVKWLNEIGFILQEELGIKYLPSEFRSNKGYERSVELANEYDLYQQDFCGCIYSKLEREKEKQLEKTLHK